MEKLIKEKNELFNEALKIAYSTEDKRKSREAKDIAMQLLHYPQEREKLERVVESTRIRLMALKIDRIEEFNPKK